jgi:hypothetical protein
MDCRANFQRSSDLKKHKIMTRVYPFIYFLILGGGKVVWGRLLITPEMHPVVPRGPDPKPWFFFGPLSGNILRASSLPETIPGR